ncbi:MAG: FkbM family methyltransferase [Opitutales bacterium]|nr:FkbM family methyltransferase [Opitutales bacterium]
MDLEFRLSALKDLSSPEELFNAEQSVVREILSCDNTRGKWLQLFEEKCHDPKFKLIDGIFRGYIENTELAWFRFMEVLKHTTCKQRVMAHMIVNAELSGRQRIHALLLKYLDKELFQSKDWEVRYHRGESICLSTSNNSEWDLCGVFNPTRHELDKSKRDLDPLLALCGWKLMDSIKKIWVVGSHVFSEKPMFDRLFPEIQTLNLFEPHPETYAACKVLHKSDSRVRIFPYALSSENGKRSFHKSSNEGLSSSLLNMKEHLKYSPEATFVDHVDVETRTWNGVRFSEKLEVPDFLLLDVQGSEFDILNSISKEDLLAIKIIYCEASTVEIYEGAKPLNELKSLLDETHQFIGFWPTEGFEGKHGNALFLNHALFDSKLSTAFETQETEKKPETGPILEERIFRELSDVLLGIVKSLKDRLVAHRDPEYSGKFLYLWGAGGYGEQLAEILKESKIPFKGFIDIDEAKWGKSLAGYPVFSPGEITDKPLKSRSASSHQPYVVIATSYQTEVKRFLSELAMNVNVDYHTIVL